MLKTISSKTWSEYGRRIFAPMLPDIDRGTDPESAVQPDLDEATSALDSDSERAIQQELERSRWIERLSSSRTSCPPSLARNTSW
jgi:hypothetical protein